MTTKGLKTAVFGCLSMVGLFLLAMSLVTILITSTTASISASWASAKESHSEVLIAKEQTNQVVAEWDARARIAESNNSVKMHESTIGYWQSVTLRIVAAITIVVMLGMALIKTVMTQKRGCY